MQTINQILHGDCIEVLKSLPENSVDLIFADPPYNLQLSNDLYRPNMTKVDAVNDGWDKFGDFAEYDEFTRKWLSAARRVLKETGTIWVIGSYHNIYRVGTILQDLGFWILNDIVWIKCLAGDTELLALVNKQPIISTIKDLVRIDSSKNIIELPSYNDEGCHSWVRLNGWKKAGKSIGLRLEFEDGSIVECTNGHCFPVARSGKSVFVRAEELKAGDAILTLGKIDIPQVVNHSAIDEKIGEFIGWYLAEESILSGGSGTFPYKQGRSIARLQREYKVNTGKSHGDMPHLAKQIIYGNLQLTRIKKIQKTNPKTYYDLSVDGNHVFALPSGILTHNSNPMPNFRGVRFTNAHETMIWAQKKKGAKYTFNHQSMKKLNEDLQMRSDWNIPLATGKQRLKANGAKAHSTQKPEALLYRVILASSNPGDLVLDPFFGSGTTGAVAKKLGRNWIGIERDKKYIKIAQKRIDAAQEADEEALHVEKRKQARVPFGALLENGLLRPGQTLYFAKNGIRAKILSNGHIRCGKLTGSIHSVAKSLMENAPANGWDVWFYKDEHGDRIVIDELRERIRSNLQSVKH